MKDKHLVSIIIPTYYTKTKDPLLLSNCLASIFNSSYKKYEIIVVDNCSQSNIALIIPKKYLNKVRLLRTKKNIGSGYASNQGAKISKGKYLFFLSDDIKLAKNTLEVLYNTAEKNDKVGIIASKEVAYDDSNIVGPTGFYLDRFLNAEVRKNPHEGRFFYAQGSSAFIPKRVFDEVKGVDSTFYLFYEDTDLSWRVRLAGYDIIHEDKAIVHHAGLQTIGKVFTPEKLYFYQRNALIMLIKNAGLYTLITFLIGFMCQSALLILYFIFNLKINYIYSIPSAYLAVLKNLKSIMLLRSRIQSKRKVGDEEIVKYFHPGWFLYERFKQINKE